MRTPVASLKARSALFMVSAFCLMVVMTATPVVIADPVAYALGDLRVLYLYDDPSGIDWPTLYHLNDRHSCRIDLLTMQPGGEFRETTRDVAGREIYSHSLHGRNLDRDLLEKGLSVLFGTRRPDIVIIGDVADNKLASTLTTYFENQPVDTAAFFNTAKMYRADDGVSDEDGSALVHINARELFERYRDRMELEIADLALGFDVDSYHPTRLKRYRLVRTLSADYPAGPDVVSGLQKLRLSLFLDSLLGEGPIARSLTNRARNYVSFFTMAQNAGGQKRLSSLVAGQKEIVSLGYQVQSEPTLSSRPDFVAYLRNLTARAQSALLKEINLDWEGQIFWRDSPHGPKLKFRATLAVNGPEEVELSYIHFHPYWDTAIIVLDSESRMVEPHQMYVREYLIDVDRQYLSSALPDSLTFSAEIVFGQIPLPVVSSIPVRDRPGLSVSFVPDFHFVAPVARINVDQVVSSMNWKAVITKPEDFAGEVTLELATPRGVFAGAYKQLWKLEPGRTRETVRIPFSVSNLFEPGIQQQTISLTEGGRQIAVDTGWIRTASCNIDDKTKVGFLPDSTGLLEDILRMTNATFQPLTDRAFVTADIDAYNVIIIGSGSFRQYPSLSTARDRLENYLRYGGSIVVLGQPSDWPEGVLPVSLLPGRERLKTDHLTNRIPQARILSQPYEINQEQLLSFFDMPREVWPAVVSPSEKVFVSPSGATLLSVSRLGDGQVIYCGLPLKDMIAELNLEGIHLLANIINY